jgi:gliding motility-associated-like protein
MRDWTKKIIIASIAFVSGLDYSFSQSIDSIYFELSPNHDGKNDTYSFHSVNMRKVAIEIKDVKGSLVYKSNNQDGSWNGDDLKGNPCCNGRYTFILDCIGDDNKPYTGKGTIMLKR